MCDLGTWSDIATIATACVAVVAFSQYQFARCKRVVALENYLRRDRDERGPDDRGRRTVLHLMAALAMSEADILDAAFRSKHIGRKTAADPETGRAAALYFFYDDGPKL